MFDDGDGDTGEPSKLDRARPAIETTPSAPAAGPRLSRRSFLRGAVAGGVAIGVASLGYWGTTYGNRAGSSAPQASPSTRPPSPQPSLPAGSRAFRTRPDLSTPLVSMTAPGLNSAPGLICLTPASGPGPIVVDSSGSPIWINPTSVRAFNLRVGTYKGSPVLSWWQGIINKGTGQGEYVLVDETYKEVARVHAGNGLQGDLHEFITTPEGTALFTAYTQSPPGTPPPGVTQLLDSVAQEVDIATGRVLFEWRASEHIGLEESYATASAGTPFDFFHINSIDVEPDGNLLISARHTWTVYKVNRKTGEIMWRLGGKHSDFEMGAGTQFAWQHDARRQPDGSITLFDDGSNGSKPPTETHSRGLVLHADELTHMATMLRDYGHGGTILALSQGSMQTLPNGNVFVGWGDQPFFTEFSADGAIVQDGRLPAVSASYRALRYTWRGKPTDRPVVAVDHDDMGGLTVYASWNGATDVAVWVVLGGDSAANLVPLGSQPRSGFETPIFIGEQPHLVAVQAVDGSGEILGQSLPIAG